MKRNIIFEKSVKLANLILSTGLVDNEGNWILKCNDDIEVMTKIQNKVYEEIDYKLVFMADDDCNNCIILNK